MKDRGRVKGKIHALKTWVAPGNPNGRGWKRDPISGLWVRENTNKNMIVLAGLSMMAQSIQYGNAYQGKTLRYMGVGTGSTAPAKTQTILIAEVERQEIDTWNNTDILSDPVVMIASVLWLTTEGNGDLMECALFQEATGTPMYCRGLFGTGLISNITQADPAVVTSSGHGLSDGDKILIENVDGMTEVNGNKYFIDKLSDDTFALYTDEGLSVSVNSGAYGAYSEASPGDDTWKLVIPKSTSETLTINYSLTFPVE